jgi:hypothetical protein
MPQKLSRAQIKEGLDQIPIESLLSNGTNKQANLTAKQKEFARGIAMGKTKAQSYRDSYNSKGKAVTQGNNASRMSKDSRIAMEVEAYKLAIEAEKHRTPIQLKALLVQQLVQHSLDEDFPPSARVQCLRLLGQLYEVGAFMERKEITTISKSGDIRARLLATLGSAIDVDVKAAKDSGAASLLEELAPAPSIVDPADPTEGVDGHSDGVAWVSPTHTIPDKQSPQKYLDKPFRGDDSNFGKTIESFENMK